MSCRPRGMLKIDPHCRPRGTVPAARSKALHRADFRASDRRPPYSLPPLVHSRRRFSSRDEDISRQHIAEEQVGRFGDADAGGGLDVFSAETVLADPQTGIWRREIATIVARAGDAKSFRHAPRAAGEAGKV